MKVSFPGIVSSLVITFNSIAFAAPDQVVLTSQDSFEGSQGGVFAPRESSNAEGTSYLFKDSISIYNVSSIGAGSSGSGTKSCFSNTNGSLAFLGQGFSFLFRDLKFSAVSSAISSTAANQSVTFSGFSVLSFVRSPASGTAGTGASSAINVSNTLDITGNTRVVFQENSSEENGGAIKAGGITIAVTKESIEFIKNSSEKQGGAVFASNKIEISKNSGDVVFSKNSSVASGGALGSSGEILIADNVSVSFLGNQVTGTTASTSGQNSGGAICGYKANTGSSGGLGSGGGGSGATSSINLKGNKNLIFSENSSTTSGGAIFAQSLTLSSGGPTVFSKNTVVGGTTPKGGAIAIEAGGKISLSADYGDITFAGNTINTPGSTPTVTRNAISIGAGGTFTNLRAAEGYSIFFYDPVTMENGTTSPPPTTTTPTLTINASDTNGSGIQYKGTIVFSGEQLSAAEVVNGNVKSTITQPVTLAAGTLALKSGVTLTTEAFTQQSGSQLLMDVGTTLVANGNITLTDLAINLNSQSSNPAVIQANSNTNNLTLSGPIQLVDTTGTYYENHDLSKTLDRELFTLKASGSVTQPTPSVSLGVPETHYGYQGTWSINWTSSAQSESKAKFTWNKTGYTPSPTRKGFYVPNSLWATFSDVRALQELMESSVQAELGNLEFWGAGFSNFMHKDRTSSRLGFRHIAAGYVLGASGQALSEDVFSMAFCQLFGRDKDYVSTKNQGTIYGGALYYEHEKSFVYAKLALDLPVVLSGHASYLYTSNEMKTSYATGSTVQGSWGNHCCALSFGGKSAFGLSEIYPFRELLPFMKLQCVYAWRQSFQEKNADARSFKKSDLLNLSLPIGITFQKESEHHPSAYDVTLIYIVDIVRKNPECVTTLLVSGDFWTTYAANFARQAMVLRLGNHYQFSPGFEMFSQLAFEFRGSSRNYNANFGGKINF
ncbi:Pmp family polymorphic membrane protein autotransporter adhesin [Chlamydia pecorum]|uniref:Pmp family polymorphic membrane protein autotransporter adhesin n=1 Tax=Chlamydia pecorum TaxID=85991 RepID=UPI0003AE6879|nr:Pmp family polymorphic membrane protein autotransporter adhesin [Chlamydia pecorum]AGW40008.1 polymorphic membrane protein [Chlamydia pecorum P787]